MDQLDRLAWRARAGDARALEAVVEATYDQVRRFCATLAGPDAADDLAQETYIRAIRALPLFRGESSVRTWLLGIARHVSLDEVRAHERRLRRDRAMLIAAAPIVADPSEEVTVLALFARLAPDRRAAFVLTQILGQSYDEAAKICQCPVGTIRSRLARARSELLELVAAPTGPRQTPGRVPVTQLANRDQSGLSARSTAV